MTTRRLPVPLIAVLALLFTACAGPGHTGDGTIDVVRMAPGLDGGFLHVSPGESYVCLETRGTPSGTVLVYDARLNTRESHVPGASVLAVSDTEDSAAAIVGTDVVLLRVPDFRKIADVPVPEGTYFDRNTRILPLSSGDFVFLNDHASGPNVYVLSATTRKFGKPGRTQISNRIRGATIEVGTDRLVLTGPPNNLEVFDLAKMESKSVVKVPVEDPSRGLVAVGGRAYVGTMNARMVPMDLATGEADPAVSLGGPGETFLALSKGSHLLAAAVQDRESRRPPYATQLRIFRRDGTNLTQIASAFLDTRSDLIDLVPLESTDTVAISTAWEFLSWRYTRS